MGSKETVTNNSTQVAEMPAFQEEFLTQEILPYAKEIAGREFEAYTGDRVAGLTPLQQQAADIYGDVAGNQLASADLSPYMSPYQQSVIDASLRTLGGAQDMALNQMEDRAQKAGAFGGSRHGVAEAETRKAYGQQASDLVTKQMQAGFMNAQQQAAADLARRQQTAAAMMSTGESARMLDQAQLEADYAEFMRQQQFPLTGLNALTLGASGIPQGYGTTTNTGSQVTSIGGMGPTLGAVGSLGMGLGPRGFGGLF